MNGKNEPLPGLLDDPQFQLPDLPAFSDFHIPPLRDPAPSRHFDVPHPLEPVTANAINSLCNARSAGSGEYLTEQKVTTLTSYDVLSTRETKKPHLAISEIIDHDSGSDGLHTHLPSFVSLSVVEKSPVQSTTLISHGHISKKLRLDQDVDLSIHDIGRQLPLPNHKEQPLSRPAPLLPAMVTGLHEPPPSAALLPSMDLDQRMRTAQAPIVRINVKDMLADDGSPIVSPAKLKAPLTEAVATSVQVEGTQSTLTQASALTYESTLADARAMRAVKGQGIDRRRARRHWTESETRDLFLGVQKHGVGKWKQILGDSSYTFTERTTVDLKDRYRVSVKSDEANPDTSASSTVPDQSLSSNGLDVSGQDVSHVSAATPSTRRRRRAWTPGEDERLIQGLQKHGFSWTTIHDDVELDLRHRRATDLRDRIRNKYPDGYKNAGSAPLRAETMKADKVKQGTKRVNSDLQQSFGDSSGGDRDKEPQSSAGLTLPSLPAFDDEDDGTNWDNTLPPLEGWDEL